MIPTAVAGGAGSLRGRYSDPPKRLADLAAFLADLARCRLKRTMAMATMTIKTTTPATTKPMYDIPLDGDVLAGASPMAPIFSEIASVGWFVAFPSP